MNRQIRRMCEYLGYQVLSLKRVRIMELTIDGLKEGGYREATQEEWKKLERGIADSSPASQQPEGRTVCLYFPKNREETAFPFLNSRSKKAK